jgi:hypothetical protein
MKAKERFCSPTHILEYERCEPSVCGTFILTVEAEGPSETLSWFCITDRLSSHRWKCLEKIYIPTAFILRSVFEMSTTFAKQEPIWLSSVHCQLFASVTNR